MQRFSFILAGAFMVLLAGCHTKTILGNEPTAAGTAHVCSSCHGLEGRSGNPTFPNLAGQKTMYLKAQLMAFHNKTRADPRARTYMWGMSATLTPRMMDEVARFYAAQKPAGGTSQNPELVAEGNKIYHSGIAASHVPACFVCHGAHGEGASVFPRLSGQWPAYIADQLHAYQQNKRQNAVMQMNARGLNDAEIAAVAAYLASL